MSRNGSGSYSLPEAAFVPNTAISSAAVNSDLSDIANALTGSLARDGQGGMTAVLPLANTGFVYLNDPNTGIRRTASDTQAISCGAVDTVSITSTGVSITGTLDVSGPINSGGAALLPIGLGPLPWSGLTAPTKWLLCYGQTLLRADYPDLWTYISAEITAGNTLFTNGNGSTTFTIMDMRGRLPAGKDNMGGSAASRLTSTYFGASAETLGAVGTSAESETLTRAQLPTGITSSGVIPLNETGLVKGTTTTLFSSTSGGNVFRAWNTADTITVVNPSAIGTVTSDNTSGNAHPNVQPTIITNYIIYAGA